MDLDALDVLALEMAAKLLRSVVGDPEYQALVAARTGPCVPSDFDWPAIDLSHVSRCADRLASLHYRATQARKPVRDEWRPARRCRGDATVVDDDRDGAQAWR